MDDTCPDGRLPPQRLRQLNGVDVEGDDNDDGEDQEEAFGPALVVAAQAVHRVVEPLLDLFLSPGKIGAGGRDDRVDRRDRYWARGGDRSLGLRRRRVGRRLLGGRRHGLASDRLALVLARGRHQGARPSRDVEEDPGERRRRDV